MYMYLKSILLYLCNHRKWSW